MPKLLRPLWLLGHLGVVVVAVVMLRLGLWQWHRGGELHAIRNYSYALEWYAFAALTLVGWIKMCHDELIPDPDAGILSGAVEGPVDSRAVARADQWDDDPEVAEWNARFAELHRTHALKQAGLSTQDIRAQQADPELADPNRRALS